MYQQPAQQPNQLPLQYVMINNQIYPVQTSNKQPGGNQIYSPVPNTFVQQNTQPYQLQPHHSLQPQPQPPAQFHEMQPYIKPVPNPVLQQIPIQSIDADEQYTHNVVCYVVTYLFFFIGCIGVQYGLNGCKTAASLWISSYVFLNVALVLFFVMKKQRFIWLLAIQSFFLSLSFILEISAFAVAVQHPVLYNYPLLKDANVYNDYRLLYSSSYYGQDLYSGDGNMCSGQYYNVTRDYCFPLQYGILAYEVLGFIFYILVFYGLARRIYDYFQYMRKNTTQVQQILPHEQNSILVNPPYQ